MFAPSRALDRAPFAQENAAEISGISPEIAALLLVIGLAGYALVNSIEIAVVAANRIRVRHLADGGSVMAKALLSLQTHQEHFFAFIVLFQNLFVVIAASMGGILAAETLGGAGGVIAGTVVMTLAMALLGEVTPKVLASRAGETYPLLVARPIRLFMFLMKPAVLVLAAAPDLLSRILFGKRGLNTTVTEAELRMLIDIGAEEGSVEEAEAELLSSVFTFGDLRLKEVMIPRNEVVWIPVDSTIADFLQVYRQSHHSRFPVFGRNHDDVRGVINIKDVLLGLSERKVGDDTPVSELTRPALFLPETKWIAEAFQQMREAGRQIAVAVDEYGGTAGIVTLEVLLEELVGQMSDELGRHREEFEVVDPRTYRLRGGMAIRDAREEIGLDLPESDQYETVAGYILDRLGRVPSPGEYIEANGLAITIDSVTNRRIDSVTVHRL